LGGKGRTSVSFVVSRTIFPPQTTFAKVAFVVVTIATGAFGVSACSEPSSLAATKKKPTKTTQKTKAAPKKKSKGSVPIADRVPTPPSLIATTATTATTVAAADPGTFAVRSDCRKVRVMPLGDSLTAFPDSYRGPLFRNLEKVGLNVDFVGSVSWAPTGGGDADSEGHGGFTIGPDNRMDSEGVKKANLADNLAEWIPAANPDLILLTIGTNDLAGGGAWTEQAPKKLTALVDQIRSLAPNAVIVLGDVPPSIYDPAGTKSTAAINAEAKRVGTADPADRVIYAMTSQRLLDLGFVAETDTADGVHFTAKGGEFFAKAWEPSLREAFRMIPKLC
jgi:lysophospholipase L1-like esterase